MIRAVRLNTHENNQLVPAHKANICTSTLLLTILVILSLSDVKVQSTTSDTTFTLRVLFMIVFLILVPINSKHQNLLVWS